MAQVARLEAKLAFNDAEFTNGIERAEKRAQTFGGRVESTFQGLFKRTPGRRAERAIGNLLGDISTGNAAQGIAQFAGRLTGLGLAAGVGIGAAVELFQKFRTDIKETDEAARALGKTLALSGGNRGPEEIVKRFSQVREEVEKLVEKSNTVGTKVSNFFDKFIDPALGSTSRGKGKAQQSEITAGINDEVKLLNDRAEAEEKSVEFKQRSLEIGQRAATVEKLRNELGIKQTAIDEENTRLKLDLFDPKNKNIPVEARDRLITASETSAKSRKETLKDDTEFQIGQLGEMTARTQERYDLEEKIANLAKSRLTGGITVEEEKKLRVAAELQDIKDQQKTATFDEKRPLQIKQLEKENELRGLTAQAKNPFAFGTIASRDFENDKGFGSIAQRNKDTNDASVFGSLGYNAAQRGESPQKKVDTTMAGLLQKLIDVTTQVWVTQ